MISVTILGWLLIIASAILLPISIISILMLLANSYGTNTFELFGFLTVIVAPPLTFLAAICLLFRMRWAHLYLLILSASLLAHEIHGMIIGPTPEKVTYSASGFKTTVMATSGAYSLPLMAICALLIVFLLSKRVRSEFYTRTKTPPPLPLPADPRGWRVGHHGRDMMYYEEWIGGAWQRIDIDGEMLMGPAHHVIYFRTASAWQAYPEWARNRREEIIARIKAEFRAPEYEYQDDTSSGGGTITPAFPTPAPVTPERRSDPKSLPVLAFGFLLFLGIAGVTGWFAKEALTTGRTMLVIKNTSHRRMVHRDQEPAMFYTIVGLQSFLCIGSLTMVARILVAGCKSGK